MATQGEIFEEEAITLVTLGTSASGQVWIDVEQAHAKDGDAAPDMVMAQEVLNKETNSEEQPAPDAGKDVSIDEEQCRCQCEKEDMDLLSKAFITVTEAELREAAESMSVQEVIEEAAKVVVGTVQAAGEAACETMRASARWVQDALEPHARASTADDETISWYLMPSTTMITSSK
uniref:Uncharacterized protein n=1 Tax=Prymnesium polylepis TaxID=72548 RepID=A0A7S4NCJ6_9EUKA